MADKPYEHARRPGKREKKPTKYALSIVGQSGEFNWPDGYEDLDGMELIVREALPGDKYRVSVEGNGRGFRRGDEFIVESREFVTNAEKMRQAGTT